MYIVHTEICTDTHIDTRPYKRDLTATDSPLQVDWMWMNAWRCIMHEMCYCSVWSCLQNRPQHPLVREDAMEGGTALMASAAASLDTLDGTASKVRTRSKRCNHCVIVIVEMTIYAALKLVRYFWSALHWQLSAQVVQELSRQWIDLMESLYCLSSQ